MNQRAQRSALPKYIQVSEMLIREIAAGHLTDGARLPPERDMATEIGISVGTLRKALADLENKGLLHRIQGSGNYVRHKATVSSVYAFFRLEKVRGGGLPTAQVLDVCRLDKPADAPAFGPSRQGHRIRRLRSLDGEVVALEEIWLDGSYRDVILAGDLSESLYHFYRRDLGLIIAAVEDRIGVATVPDWTVPGFAPGAGTKAGFIERLSWAQSGDPTEFSRTWFDNDKARYVSRMGKG
jgi:GntR family transcriptional regulator